MALFNTSDPQRTAPKMGQFASHKNELKKKNNFPLLILLMILMFG